MVGLGYVGLPVAVAFGRAGSVIGFDVDAKRIAALKRGRDKNNEVPRLALKSANIRFTTKPQDLHDADFHIVTVPTPIDDAKNPDLGPLYRATQTVGSILKKGDIVVYESTVYPGVTEEECLPLLEKHSGLKGGVDFKVGYSPERINPGDPKRRFETIKKVVSGMDANTLAIVAKTYGRVVRAGIHRAPSIKVAEAAKVIENTQRDINIALMNELALIFDRMGLATHDVLTAAATKWNFAPFTPGLVGGHCIGVDPYYLTHKAQTLGYLPQVILAGRRINDSMGVFVAHKTIEKITGAGLHPRDCLVTVLGLAFKENCPDIRNTRVTDIVSELKHLGITVQLHDPLADPVDAERFYDLKLTPLNRLKPAHAVIIAVAHDVYKKLPVSALNKLLRPKGVVVDVKGIRDAAKLRRAGHDVWQL